MNALAKSVILKDDPFVDWGEAVEFRLTYEGVLLSDSGKGSAHPGRAKHKQEIRKHFHKQLKRAWSVLPQLKRGGAPMGLLWDVTEPDIPSHTLAKLAERYERHGYNYVPLVTRDLALYCSIDVLFLRPEPPGGVLQNSDIDNRVKTLMDGLKMPSNANEVGPYAEPEEDERPFFVLLEDDSAVTRLSVETDTLLEPTSMSANDARCVLTVRLKPLFVHAQNLHFG